MAPGLGRRPLRSARNNRLHVPQHCLPSVARCTLLSLWTMGGALLSLTLQKWVGQGRVNA